MEKTAELVFSLEKKDVPLAYPGAEGVTFQDALLSVTNAGATAVEGVRLRFTVKQEEALLFEGELTPSLLGREDRLAPGETTRLSLFRLMQKAVLGFGSKVNMFGYKAALNWGYGVEVSPVGGKQAFSRVIRWRISDDNPLFVEVEIA